MNREVHVRFCERLRGKFPRPTRPSQLTASTKKFNSGGSTGGKDLNTKSQFDYLTSRRNEEEAIII